MPHSELTTGVEQLLGLDLEILTPQSTCRNWLKHSPHGSEAYGTCWWSTCHNVLFTTEHVCMPGTAMMQHTHHQGQMHQSSLQHAPNTHSLFVFSWSFLCCPAAHAAKATHPAKATAKEALKQIHGVCGTEPAHTTHTTKWITLEPCLAILVIDRTLVVIREHLQMVWEDMQWCLHVYTSTYVCVLSVLAALLCICIPTACLAARVP